MTIETHKNASGNILVSLVECPFCGASIGATDPPDHLQKCAEFYRRFDVEVPEKAQPSPKPAQAGVAT